MSQVEPRSWITLFQHFVDMENENQTLMKNASDNMKEKHNEVSKRIKTLGSASWETLSHFLTRECGELGVEIHRQIHLDDHKSKVFYIDGKEWTMLGLYEHPPREAEDFCLTWILAKCMNPDRNCGEDVELKAEVVRDFTIVLTN